MTDTPAFSPRRAWARALERTASIAASPEITLPVVIDRLAERFGDAPALIGEDETLSFAQLAARSHAYARWGLAQGIAAGDVVGLMRPNAPDYLAAWLGLTRIGAVVALVNTALTGAALTHAVALAAPKHLIAGSAFTGALDAIRGGLAAELRCWSEADGDGFARLDLAIGGDVPKAVPTLAERALYIYTSGTTGLPKAAIVSHYRVMQWSHWFAGMLDTAPGDRLYDCLPMYHSIGGVAATGAALVNGAAVVVRERFSARRFWDDIVDCDCTLFQYIGELCRYLADAPPHPRERAHRLRLCCGNGLRGDVWRRFQARFAIPHIIEYYAATEASFSLYNCEGRPGAIGRVPPYLAHRFAVALVRVDPETGMALRDADGLCLRCGVDEPGEALGRLATDATGDAAGADGGRFEGYTDRAASDAKILRGVFAPGDAWFRTGDLMRRDAQGFFHFVDRLGDTFRWKGENVSTSEIEAVAAAAPGVAAAAVYGVRVAGAEGRAGMAAVVPEAGFEPAALHRHFAAHLPAYARPVFLRLTAAIDTTATFRAKKHALAAEGYDPGAVTDPLFIDDPESGGYMPLDAARHAALLRGDMRL